MSRAWWLTATVGGVICLALVALQADVLARRAVAVGYIIGIILVTYRDQR